MFLHICANCFKATMANIHSEHARTPKPEKVTKAT